MPARGVRSAGASSASRVSPSSVVIVVGSGTEAQRRVPPAVTTDFDFDRETRVAALGDGRYETELDRAWWVHRGPNGGYLAAIVLRALADAVGDDDRAPRSLTVHYAEPPVDG